ncbi:hypothetical protein TIFTF001_006582 [Ficus carica]|uniref:Uncharacterized protein n=1 Tax=Ficus carica TaxID=3494 RepID=A0AA88CW55_FICCA|nr:hypothetical protein TIFTF001_006582 [Ficus carica]
MQVFRQHRKLQPQVLVKPLDELLGGLVHLAAVDVVRFPQRERRVCNPQLPDDGGAPAEAGERRGGLDCCSGEGLLVVAVEHLEDGLDGIGGGVVVVGGRRMGTGEEVVRVAAVVLGGGGEVEGAVVRGVAAAELVLADGDGEVGGGGGGGGGAAEGGGGGGEMEGHEVGEGGFAGELAALHEHVEVEEELAF